LFSPVSGVVKEINASLDGDPALINQSPYEQGWFLKIEMSEPAELDGLMSKDDYNKMIGTD